MLEVRKLLTIFAAAVFLAGCGGKETTPAVPSAVVEISGAMTVSSEAFQDGAAIPVKYSCDGENINPALHWSNVPEQAKSLALVVEDPDAPGSTFYHWVLYNLPPTVTTIQGGLPKDNQTFTQGQGSFSQTGYGGPCPPEGQTHHYFFKVYALDLEPTLPAGFNATSLQRAMDGHILAQGQLIGTFQH